MTTTELSPTSTRVIHRSDTYDLASVVAAASEQFESVSGRPPESVVGARSLHDVDGWAVLIEVVEMAGIPESTSLLALYKVDLDDSCHLVSFERLRRYVRSASDPL